MQTKKQIQDWEKRLIDLDRKFSDVCRAANVNPPLITQWRKRDSNLAEIDLLNAFIDQVGFGAALEFIRSKFEPSSSLHIWMRIENQIQSFELQKITA
jgi:hypothetical protein